MTDKKKRPTRHVARVPCKDKDELAKLHRIAKSRGRTFAGMVKEDYLGQDVERVLTFWQEALDAHFNTLKDIFKWLQETPHFQDMLAADIKEELQKTLKAWNDSKVQQPSKRKRAD